MKFSTSTALVLAASASTVSAQFDYQSYLASYMSLYATNSAWLSYIQTHSFTTPAALESWITRYETLTDLGAISSALRDYPTAELSDYLTQFLPTSLIGAVATEPAATETADTETAATETAATETDATETGTSASEDTSSARSTITTVSTQRSSAASSGAASGSASSSRSASAASSESAASSSATTGAAINTMVPYAAVVGLSGVVAGLVLF